MTEHWVPDPDKISNEYALYLVAEGPWWDVNVRHDGCVHLRRYHNAPRGVLSPEEESKNEDYLHICQLDRLIEALQELQVKAKHHFGEMWA